MKFICKGEEVTLRTISEASGESEATIIDMVRKSSTNKIELDGWVYEVEYDNTYKPHGNLKLDITNKKYCTKKNISGVRLQRIFTYEGKEYTLGQFSDLLGVVPASISVKTRGLKSFDINGVPVTVEKERIGAKYDLSKDGEWICKVTLTEAQEYTGHHYKTLNYHCKNKTYTSDGWCIRLHKPVDK